MALSVSIPLSARRAVKRYSRAKARAEAEFAKSLEAARQAARALVAAGVSLRDAGAVLGLSHERVRQLAEES
jgi:hypothetical protein